MNVSTATENTTLFPKEKKNISLLTAFLFKPSVGVLWLPEDVKFSKICSPLIAEVNMYTFEEILILYSILMPFFQV